MTMTTRATSPRRGRASDFTLLFQQHVVKASKRQAAIAQDADLDPGYLCKLLKGERDHPSRNVIIRLAVWGLGLSMGETDELLQAAEKAPLSSLI
jgi:hypothetical protein